MPRLPASLRVICVTAFALGCAEPPPQGTPTTLKTYPHATDRLARLMARQLTDPDPFAVQQLVVCEEARLNVALGADESMLRAQRVHDSIYAFPGSDTARRRIRSTFGGRSVEFMGPLCDSLNAIADREDPIIKVATSGARPDSGLGRPGSLKRGPAGVTF